MGIGTRNLALLLAAALLLVVSSASGDLDEVQKQELQKFLRARPLGGGDAVKVGHVPKENENAIARAIWIPQESELQKVWRARPLGEGDAVKAGHVPEENEYAIGPPIVIPRTVDSAVSHLHGIEEARDLNAEDDKKGEGVVARVWSYLRGLKNPLGDAFNSRAERVEERKVAHAEEESHGHRHRHGPHGPRAALDALTFFRGIRDSMRKHPERNAAVISATEPLVLEDVPSSAAEFVAKMIAIVGKVLDDYYASSITPEEATTCVGILEEQVKNLVRNLKSALQEQLCENGVALSAEQNFCNLFNIHPKMATLMVFQKADVNPVTVALMRTSTAGFCTSAKDNGELLNSVDQVESVTRHLPLHMFRQHLDSDMYNEQDREEHHMPRMFHNHEHEHKEYDHEGHHIFGMFREHMHDMPEKFYRHQRHEEPQLHMKPQELEHVHEQLENHGWHHEHNEMNVGDVMGADGHVNGNSCKDCHLRGVRRLTRSIRLHMAITCQFATNPKLIAACKFAKEHKFLTKTYLAVKVPILDMVDFHCAHRCAAPRSFMFDQKNRHAPNLGITRLGNYVLEDGEKVPHPLVSDFHLPHLRHWASGACARRHANEAFNRALQLRGHVIGVSNDNNNGEDGLPGLVRTHLVVLKRHSVRPEHFQDALDNIHSLGSRDMFSDLQDQVAKLVDVAVSSESGVQAGLIAGKMSKPLHQHPKTWNFRISAKPRPIPVSKENELDALKGHDLEVSTRKATGDNEATRITGSEIELQNITEGGRAEM